MSTKDAQNELVSNMRKWQKIEDASVSSTGQIIEKTDNPLVRVIMEIIQRDSQTHYRIEQLIADSVERQAVSLSPDELVEVWQMIEHHIEIEKKSVELAQQVMDALQNQQGMIVQEYFARYLLKDEKKHDDLLSLLDEIKKGTYRSV